ncbi:hypothetical protein M0638_23205 [Roseomonas sp. NAR14]|uniref:Uncharacterized protein n=1 Tax=Roseomonas acroporae TaxID=2937791 RepID=A0A9X1YCM0_9PROT|nr:hypothetical protein [Roseomonas acroporae]MCK8787285.1 hypothetical protein [Roseomonas acroporae]
MPAMQRQAIYQYGIDCDGARHRRLRRTVVVLTCRRQALLFPRIVAPGRIAAGREVWRNGLQQRRWQAVTAVLRAERRSFLMTLPRPPLVPPVLPRFG